MLETCPAVSGGDYHLVTLKSVPQDNNHNNNSNNKRKSLTLGKRRKSRRSLQQHSKSPYNKPIGLNIGNVGVGVQLHHHTTTTTTTTIITTTATSTAISTTNCETSSSTTTCTNNNNNTIDNSENCTLEIRDVEKNKDCFSKVFVEVSNKIFNQPIVDGNFDEDLLNEKLKILASQERLLPWDATNLYEVESQITDKVNGAMRDEAILNMRFLHKGYFNISSETFARAVLIVDHFIMKVRVKPKYMNCVAVAAYFIAAEIHEDCADQPSKDILLALTHCGGTVEDLGRMVDIIKQKLNGEFSGSTAIEFAKVIMDSRISQCNGSVQSRVVNRIMIAMTSLYIYRYRASTVALAALLLETDENNQLDINNLFKAANLLNIDRASVENCAHFMHNIYSQYYQRTLPSSRPLLYWCLSRRTRSHLSAMRCTSVTLDPIAEVNECCVDVQ